MLLFDERMVSDGPNAGNWTLCPVDDIDLHDLIACDLILGGTGLPMEHGCPPLSSLHTGNIIPRTAPDELGALFLYRLPGVHVFLELHDVDRLAVNFLDTAQRSQDLILVVGGTLAIG